MIGLAIRGGRSSGTAAGSILSTGLRTRFWIMRIRRDRDMVLFGMGMLILAVLCGVSYFYKISARIFSEGLYGMYSWLVCMERRELCKAFPHLREWCAKGLWAPFSFQGSCLDMDWKLWKTMYKIRRSRMLDVRWAGSVLKSRIW